MKSMHIEECRCECGGHLVIDEESGFFCWECKRAFSEDDARRAISQWPDLLYSRAEDIINHYHHAAFLKDKIAKLEARVAELEEGSLGKPIVKPLGWGAGELCSLQTAMAELVVEIVGYRSDLIEIPPRKLDQGVINDSAILLQRQTDAMERFAAALWLIYWQTLRPDQKANWRNSGLIKIATKYGLSLPDDLKGDKEHD